MYPNQEEYPIDYLNNIAAPAKKPGLDKKFLFMVGGGLLAAIILVIILISAGSSGGASSSNLQTLSVRLETLSAVTKTAQKVIRSNTLRTTNANLMVFLTNATTDLKAPLTSAGITHDKIDKTILSKNDGTQLKKTLEDARLNITAYDRTYASEMSHELGTLHALMQNIYQSTNSKSMKDVLVKADDNLTSVLKQVDSFDDTTK